MQKKLVTLKVGKKIKNELKRIAADKETTIKDLVEQALIEYYEIKYK